MGVLEGKESEKRTERLFKKIMFVSGTHFQEHSLERALCC